MKRIIRIILLITLVFNFTACGNTKSQKSSSNDSFDIKIATNIVDTYMKYLLKNDTDNAKKFYSSKLAKDVKSTFVNDEKIVGYSISETNESGKDASIKVRVARIKDNKPIASLDEYTIAVKKEKNDYKIDEIKNEIQKEVFSDYTGLRLRSRNNTDTNLLINAEGIPEYTFSKDDKANLYKLQVPKQSFGVSTFSYEGDKLAYTTYDKDYFIGIVSIDETMATQAGGGGKGDQGGGAGGAGGAGGQQGGTQIKPRETPIGKDSVAVDLLKNTAVQFMSFSQDGKFLLVQYDKPGQGRCIRVYKSDNGDMIPVKFEEKYPLDKVEVVFSSYDENTLNYEVVAKPAATKDLTGSIGKWQMNLKDFKMKKI